jgi:DNA-binding NarL/FixJ family response regulator
MVVVGDGGERPHRYKSLHEVRMQGADVSEFPSSRRDYLRLLTPGSDAERPGVPDVQDDEDVDVAQEGGSVGVLIADGQALIRAGYRVLLELEEWIDVVGEAASGHQAVAVAAQTRPDVALVDLGLPGLEHPDATTRVISHPALADAAVMVITASDDDERVLSALRAGAVGVIAKDAEPGELRGAVHVLAAGEAVLPRAVVRRLVSQLPPHGTDRQPVAQQLDELTEREREVVTLVGAGLTNEEIADVLVISVATAKTHVYRAMTKLAARHRAELVVMAYETGLVLPHNGSIRPPHRTLAIA